MGGAGRVIVGRKPSDASNVEWPMQQEMSQ
jgi:hypothetical protein